MKSVTHTNFFQKANSTSTSSETSNSKIAKKECLILLDLQGVIVPNGDADNPSYWSKEDIQQNIDVPGAYWSAKVLEKIQQWQQSTETRWSTFDDMRMAVSMGLRPTRFGDGYDRVDPAKLYVKHKGKRKIIWIASRLTVDLQNFGKHLKKRPDSHSIDLSTVATDADLLMIQPDEEVGLIPEHFSMIEKFMEGTMTDEEVLQHNLSFPQREEKVGFDRWIDRMLKLKRNMLRDRDTLFGELLQKANIILSLIESLEELCKIGKNTVNDEESVLQLVKDGREMSNELDRLVKEYKAMVNAGLTTKPEWECSLDVNSNKLLIVVDLSIVHTVKANLKLTWNENVIQWLKELSEKENVEFRWNIRNYSNMLKLKFIMRTLTDKFNLPFFNPLIDFDIPSINENATTATPPTTTAIALPTAAENTNPYPLKRDPRERTYFQFYQDIEGKRKVIWMGPVDDVMMFTIREVNPVLVEKIKKDSNFLVILWETEEMRENNLSFIEKFIQGDATKNEVYVEKRKLYQRFDTALKRFLYSLYRPFSCCV
jgi:hypothetical protein